VRVKSSVSVCYRAQQGLGDCGKCACVEGRRRRKGGRSRTGERRVRGQRKKGRLPSHHVKSKGLEPTAPLAMYTAVQLVHVGCIYALTYMYHPPSKLFSLESSLHLSSTYPPLLGECSKLHIHSEDTFGSLYL